MAPPSRKTGTLKLLKRQALRLPFRVSGLSSWPTAGQSQFRKLVTPRYHPHPCHHWYSPFVT